MGVLPELPGCCLLNNALNPELVPGLALLLDIGNENLNNIDTFTHLNVIDTDN